MWISPEYVPSSRCVVDRERVILVIGDLQLASPYPERGTAYLREITCPESFIGGAPCPPPPIASTSPLDPNSARRLNNGT
jgi:hypothetical protein